MYYLKPGSLRTETPVFQKLSQDGLLFPEHTTGFWFADKGVPEGGLIQWAQQFLPADKWFIDIGAHVGTYTLPFAKKGAGVHAFECSPRTYNFLCANIALHDLDFRVKTYNVALGASEGTTRYFFRSPDGGGNGCLEFGKDQTNSSVQVPLKRLDDYGFTDIALLKIDVEGYEKQVLEGAQETLKRNNYPPFLFESWEGWRTREGMPAVDLRNELFAYIESTGYTIVPIRGNAEMFLAEKK